jgi:uncharacterized membrane protein YdbT with pleckstrin-like domain
MQYNGGLSQSGKSVPSSPSAVQVRPSRKLVRPWYYLGFLVLALAFFYNNNGKNRSEWLLLLCVPFFLWAIVQHIRQHFTVLTVTAGRLRYETGLLRKTTRTIDLRNIQNVRVDQSMMERIFGLGTISLETAGESGGFGMHNVDRPQMVADYILEAAGK